MLVHWRRGAPLAYRQPLAATRASRFAFLWLSLVFSTGADRVSAQVPTPRFSDRVTVERVVVDARVLDVGGGAVIGLGRDDFVVKVDGQEVALESSEWVDERGLPDSTVVAAREPAAVPVPARTGRLVVFYFQNDFYTTRLTGLMRMWPRAVRLLDQLNPDDRVAVASFDSHLKLHCDFTADHTAIRSEILPTTIFREPEPPSAGPEPSIAAHFDTEAARQAATQEQGLAVLARALTKIPGAKTMVMFGWGLGHLSWPIVVLPDEYFEAARLLAQARTTVLALDITDADYHSLEVGLERVAADTGGFYAKTHLFPDSAMAHVVSALAGHYELVFEKPDLPPGTHRISVELSSRKATVLARNWYAD